MVGTAVVRNRKYKDCYVAIASFNDNRVIAYGSDPHIIARKAIRKGYPKHVIVYVPKKGAVDMCC